MYGTCTIRRTVRRINSQKWLKTYTFYTNQINGTIRRGMGRDIDAACGQLRRNYMQQNQ